MMYENTLVTVAIEPSEISNQSHQYKVDDKAINITTKRGVSVISIAWTESWKSYCG
jgi:hypothetical protein